MAISVNNRTYFENTTDGSTQTTNSAVSGAFTPAAGCLLAVCIIVEANGADANTGTFTVTDSFGDSGGTAWTAGPSCIRSPVAAFQGRQHADIYYRTVGTGPGSSTITVTASWSASFAGWLWCDPFEITGQHASPIGLSTGNTTRSAGGSTTLSMALGGTPATDSLILSCLYQDNSLSVATIPSGYTDGHHEEPSWFGADGHTAYLNGGGATPVDWTGCDTAAHLLGSALEIKAAAAAVADAGPGRRLGPGGGSPAFLYIQRYGIDGVARVNAPAELAGAVTVTAFDLGKTVATTAGNAAVTATGNDPAGKVAPNSGAGAVTATANNATLALATTGGLGSVGATAGGGAGSVAVGPTATTVTVSAFNATVSTAVATSANAGNAPVTVTSFDAGKTVAPNTGSGAVTVTASNPALSLKTTAGVGSVGATAGGGAGSVAVGPTAASVTVSAFNATVTTSAAGTANAQAASVTVTGYDAATKVAPNAGLASVTVSAFNATVSTTVATNAPAGNAAVTVTAFNATCKVSFTAQVATVSVISSPAVAAISPAAGAATVTTAAQNAKTAIAVSALVALVSAISHSPAVDNGEGVATLIKAIRVHRPEVIRLERPDID